MHLDPAVLTLEHDDADGSCIGRDLPISVDAEHTVHVYTAAVSTLVVVIIPDPAGVAVQFDVPGSPAVVQPLTRVGASTVFATTFAYAGTDQVVITLVDANGATISPLTP